ncbi:hypothetical protein PCE1_002033 [Barthelona sp. PCE]
MSNLLDLVSEVAQHPAVGIIERFKGIFTVNFLTKADFSLFIRPDDDFSVKRCILEVEHCWMDDNWAHTQLFALVDRYYDSIGVSQSTDDVFVTQSPSVDYEKAVNFSVPSLTVQKELFSKRARALQHSILDGVSHNDPEVLKCSSFVSPDIFSSENVDQYFRFLQYSTCYINRLEAFLLLFLHCSALFLTFNGISFKVKKKSSVIGVPHYNTMILLHLYVSVERWDMKGQEKELSDMRNLVSEVFKMHSRVETFVKKIDPVEGFEFETPSSSDDETEAKSPQYSDFACFCEMDKDLLLPSLVLVLLNPSVEFTVHHVNLLNKSILRNGGTSRFTTAFDEIMVSFCSTTEGLRPEFNVFQLDFNGAILTRVGTHSFVDITYNVMCLYCILRIINSDRVISEEVHAEVKKNVPGIVDFVCEFVRRRNFHCLNFPMSSKEIFFSFFIIHFFTEFLALPVDISVIFDPNGYIESCYEVLMLDKIRSSNLWECIVYSGIRKHDPADIKCVLERFNLYDFVFSHKKILFGGYGSHIPLRYFDESPLFTAAMVVEGLTAALE